MIELANLDRDRDALFADLSVYGYRRPIIAYRNGRPHLQDVYGAVPLWAWAELYLRYGIGPFDP